MNLPSVSLLAVAGDSGVLFDFLHTMKGPDFLVLYGGWFVITFGIVLVLRRQDHDNVMTTLAGLACFIGLGLARLIDGSAHGMHKWNLLIAMMIIGGFCFVIRLEQSSGGSSDGSSWWSSCSTGGGCGGGGCGGGGCGGCGGG